jgi:hypothetical protein
MGYIIYYIDLVQDGPGGEFGIYRNMEVCVKIKIKHPSFWANLSGSGYSYLRYDAIYGPVLKQALSLYRGRPMVVILDGLVLYVYSEAVLAI